MTPLTRRSAAHAGGDAALCLALALALLASATRAQTTPACALSGSPNVMINGVGMLRLGDVQGCPGLRYEIIPGLIINGQPAVRLLPADDCAAAGSENALADGAPLSRRGDLGACDTAQ